MISISAEDNASTVIQKVQTQLQGLPASVSIKIGASDQATEKFERLRELVAGFKGFTIMLSAEDQISPAVQKYSVIWKMHFKMATLLQYA